jgi:broad-specificity NMP kinase
MSNILNINVVRVQNLATGEYTYGFIAKDDHATVADVDFETMEDFLNEYASEKQLILGVILNESMHDTAHFTADQELVLDTVTAINVKGYPTKPWDGKA